MSHLASLNWSETSEGGPDYQAAERLLIATVHGLGSLERISGVTAPNRPSKFLILSEKSKYNFEILPSLRAFHRIGYAVLI